jgi:hypothetical protein
MTLEDEHRMKNIENDLEFITTDMNNENSEVTLKETFDYVNV